jgi:hypothetical protein
MARRERAAVQAELAKAVADQAELDRAFDRVLEAPFVIGRDGTREEVIAKYRAWIVRRPALVARRTSCAAKISSAGARPSAAMRRC